MNGEYEHKFGLLLDAMLNDREQVIYIVDSDRSILEATNRAGENLLRWFALENCLDEVKFLRLLGSTIQPEAFSEAVGMGNTKMVGLLLELGAEPDLDSCSRELECEINELSSHQKYIIRSHLKDYGYDI